MRKYYYYTYQTKSGTGYAVSYSDTGEFELFERTKWISNHCKQQCIITNWKEISCTQYEKMRDYFENQNK